MTRRSHSRTRLLFWWAAVALLVVLFSHAPSLGAQSTECQAVNMAGLPRDCTFLEEHGMCLTNALDSYNQCVDSADNWFDRAACEIGVQVDLFACNIALPWHLVKMIVD